MLKKILSTASILAIILTSASGLVSALEEPKLYDYSTIGGLPREAVLYYTSIDSMLREKGSMDHSMASWYESESYGQEYLNQFRKNEAIRSRYYKEAQNLAMSDTKSSFEISSAERSEVESGIVDIQALFADIIDDAMEQTKAQGWLDKGASSIKNELDIQTPYGKLSIQATPTNVLLNKIKGQAELDITINSNLSISNKIVSEMVGSGVSTGVATFQLKASGQVKIINDDIYTTLKTFDLSSNRSDATQGIQDVTKPHIGVTYKMSGGRELMQAWKEIDNEELYKEAAVLTAKLRTTSLLTPYNRLSDGSYALRTNPTPWRSTLKRSSSGIGEMIPRTAKHNFSNLIYQKDAGITLKMDRSSGYQGSLNLDREGAYLAMDLDIRNKTDRIKATLHKNAFSWDATFEDGSSKGVLTATALSGSLHIKSLSQRWSMTGDETRLTISEQGGAKLEITQTLSSSSTNRSNKTLVTVMIPESYLAYLIDESKEYTDISFPRHIELRHMLDWTQTLQDITITRPDEYIDIDSYE